MNRRRLRYMAEFRPKRFAGQLPQDIAFLPMELIGDQGGFDHDSVRAAAEVPDGYTYFERGDVLRAKVTPCFENGKGAYLRDLAATCGLGSTELVALKPLPDTDPRFLYYTMASDEFVQGGIAALYGAHGVKRVPDDYFRNFRAWAPMLAKQTAVADYLDRETGTIDALIEKRRRILTLLADRRESTRDAVFQQQRGYRLKHLLAAPMAYGVLVPEFVDPGTGVPMVRTYNLTERGEIDRTDIAEIPLSLAAEYRRTRLSAGDLVLSVVGSMGRAAVVDDRAQGFNLNRPLARLQPSADVPSRLLWHWTQTRAFMDMARLATGGSTAQPTLNLGDLANFAVGLPPESSSWIALSQTLDRDTSLINRQEDAVRREVGLLHERREALITAAVNGEIDIPTAD